LLSLLQPSLLKNYENYKKERERIDALSLQDSKDEEELLKIIEETAVNDRVEFKKVQETGYSELYGAKFEKPEDE